MLTTPFSAVKVLTWTRLGTWIQFVPLQLFVHLASKYHSQFCHLFYPEFQNKLDIDCNRSMALKMHTTQEFDWMLLVNLDARCVSSADK